MQLASAAWTWPGPMARPENAGEIVNQQTVAGHRDGETMRETIDTEDFV